MPKSDVFTLDSKSNRESEKSQSMKGGGKRCDRMSVKKRRLEKQALRPGVSLLQNTPLFVLFSALLDPVRLCQ
jgi:hypothetical protein